MKRCIVSATLLCLGGCNIPGIPLDGISASGGGPIADTGDGPTTGGEAGGCGFTLDDGVACEQPEAYDAPLLGIPAAFDYEAPAPAGDILVPGDAQAQQEALQDIIDEAGLAYFLSAGGPQLTVHLQGGDYVLRTGLTMRTGVLLIGERGDADTGVPPTTLRTQTLGTALLTFNRVENAGAVQMTLRHEGDLSTYPLGDGVVRARGVHLSRTTDVVLAFLRIEGAQEGIMLSYSQQRNFPAAAANSAGDIPYDPDVCQGWITEGEVIPDPGGGFGLLVAALVEDGTNIRPRILFNEIQSPACTASFGLRLHRAKDALILGNHLMGATSDPAVCPTRINEGIKMNCGPFYGNVITQNYISGHDSDGIDGAWTDNAVESPLKNRFEGNLVYNNLEAGIQWKASSANEILDANGVAPLIPDPAGLINATDGGTCYRQRTRLVGDNAFRRNLILGNARAGFAFSESVAPTWCESQVVCEDAGSTDPCRALRVTGNVIDKGCDLSSCTDGQLGFGLAINASRAVRITGNWFSEHRVGPGACVPPLDTDPDTDPEGDCSIAADNAMVPGWYQDPTAPSYFPFAGGDSPTFDLTEASLEILEPLPSSQVGMARTRFIEEQLDNGPGSRDDVLSQIIRPGSYHCRDTDFDGCENGCEVLLGRDPLSDDGGTCATTCDFFCAP